MMEKIFVKILPKIFILVQLTISFVQHQIRAALQVRRLLREKVDESSRGGDDDLASALQVVLLRTFRCAAEHASVANSNSFAELRGNRLDLLRKLARGSQNECDGSVAALKLLLVGDVHESGQDVSEGFA